MWIVLLEFLKNVSKACCTIFVDCGNRFNFIKWIGINVECIYCGSSLFPNHEVFNLGGDSISVGIQVWWWWRKWLYVQLRQCSPVESGALLQPLPCGRVGLKMKLPLPLPIFIILIRSLLLHFSNNGNNT